VSPRTATGQQTGSISLVLIPPDTSPAAVPDTGGFTLTIYRVIPTLQDWGALATYSGLAYRDQLVLPDISGGWGLYFVFGNLVGGGTGIILLGIAELA
jgi:hypothetical protein